MYARIYPTPHNPDTEKQRANRIRFRDAINEWKLLSPEEKYRYTKRSRRLPMTGHNLFISEYMKKHLADKGIEKSDSVSKRCKIAFNFYTASIQAAVPSIIPPSLLLSGLYTVSEPRIYGDSHG